MATSVHTKSFRKWLAKQPAELLQCSVPEMVRSFGGQVSWSGAYRSAAELGLKSVRRNYSRYDEFWSLLNWKLPDLVLGRIWCVHRSNVRARRIRLKLAAALWELPRDSRRMSFQCAVREEMNKSCEFSGPRPDPASRRVGAAKEVVTESMCTNAVR